MWFFELNSDWETALPGITLLIVWVVFITITLFSYIFCRPYESWFKIYDKCNPNEVKHQYVIRMILADASSKYKTRSTSLKMEILGSNNQQLSAFQIKPFVAKRAIENGGTRVIQLLFLRKTPLIGITKVSLNHNGEGSIKVVRVEIQELTSKEANIAIINSFIEKHSRRKVTAKQTFPADTKEYRTMDFSEQYSKLLDFTEYFTFLWFQVNLILMFSIFLIICFESEVPKDLSQSLQNVNETTTTTTTMINKTTKITKEQHLSFACNSYKESWISSLLTGGVASLLSFVINLAAILTFRFAIKGQLYSSYQFDCWCKIYIILVFILGGTAGIVAVLLVYNRFTGNASKEYIYWIASVGIGLLLFIFVWLPLFACFGWLIGFFQVQTEADTTQYDSDTQRYLSAIEGKSKLEVGADKSEVKEGADKSDVSKQTSSDITGIKYYEEIMKKKGRVRSISKY